MGVIAAHAPLRIHYPTSLRGAQLSVPSVRDAGFQVTRPTTRRLGSSSFSGLLSPSPVCLFPQLQEKAHLTSFLHFSALFTFPPNHHLLPRPTSNMHSFFTRLLPSSQQPQPFQTLPSPPRSPPPYSLPSTLVLSTSPPLPSVSKPSTRTFSSSSSSSRRATSSEREGLISWLEQALREDGVAERAFLLGRKSASERPGMQLERSGEDDAR